MTTKISFSLIERRNETDMKCEHCGEERPDVKSDRWGNWLCWSCTEREADAEWNDE